MEVKRVFPYKRGLWPREDILCHVSGERAHFTAAPGEGDIYHMWLFGGKPRWASGNHPPQPPLPPPRAGAAASPVRGSPRGVPTRGKAPRAAMPVTGFRQPPTPELALTGRHVPTSRVRGTPAGGPLGAGCVSAPPPRQRPPAFQPRNPTLSRVNAAERRVARRVHRRSWHLCQPILAGCSDGSSQSEAAAKEWGR